MYRNILILIIALSFSGCGGGGSSAPTTTTTPTSPPATTPTISLPSNNSTHVYAVYTLQPIVTPTLNTITFTIQNKPSWATFNTTTGLLEGIPPPGSEGNYSNITISAINGTNTTRLTPFNIVVNPAIDIAHRYGKAMQGAKTGTDANAAIDANDTSRSEAYADPTNNVVWWQLTLPSPTLIHKIRIKPLNAWYRDLQNAKVYLSNTEYNGTVNATDLIATLQGGVNDQFLNYPLGKQGTYLIILRDTQRTDGHQDTILNLASVEVYGTMPTAPHVTHYIKQFLISGATTTGTNITTVSAIDYQGDPLTYTILGNVPFSIDNQGVISVNGPLTLSHYTFTIEISDGVHTVTIPMDINITSSNAVNNALTTGQVSSVTEGELIQAARDEIASMKQGNPLLQDIYQTGAINYAPGNYYSQLISIIGDNKKIFPLIYGDKNNTLAIAGTKGISRFAVFASNPLWSFVIGKNTLYEPYMKRIFAWLLGGSPINMATTGGIKRIALSFTSNSVAIKQWIALNYPSWQIIDCNNNATLATCYSGTDLIIMGRSGVSADAQAVNGLLPGIVNSGEPILYLHDNWGQNSFSDMVASFFEFTFSYAGNYWIADQATWGSVAQMQSAYFNGLGYQAIDIMLQHFQNADYFFDWTQCQDSQGNLGSQNDICTNVPLLSSDFETGATRVRKMLTALDVAEKDIFQSADYRFQKLLALIGDKLRQSVVYPMDKVLTDDTVFMKSYYADHAVYNYRMINPVQPDMGNFSRSDFTLITPVSKSVSLVSKQPFRAAGVYALPGQTVTVTRRDNSNAVVKVIINTLRSGATHQYQPNGYNRPKYLQSPYFELKPNTPINITSPYGGPLQIWCDTNDMNLTVDFNNVGLHPVWSEYDTNVYKDTLFAQALADNQYDWAEIITSAFEVHSKRDKMMQSINDIRWGSASALANATKIYASSHPMALSGFKGPGIEIINDITNFATNKNIPIYNADFVKHMNADQANCGSGCSGNPYDAYWAFNPISHGDIHEVGHSLERANFRLNGWELHSSTNYYAYYTQMRYNQNIESNASILNKTTYYMSNAHVSVSVYRNLYTQLQQAVAAPNPQTYLQTNLWATSNYSTQSLFMIQAMMYAQKYATGTYALSNGFHLLGRLHVLDRYLSRDAKTNWTANSVKIGFDTYTLTEINAITSNDWLVVSLSFATGLDFRPFFDMYGEPYSLKASTQIAGFGFPAVNKVFFAEKTDSGFISPNDGSGAYLNKTEIPVDGTTVYPY